MSAAIKESQFTFPALAEPGFVWWTRPSYFSSGFSIREDGEVIDRHFEWTCAFCHRREDTPDNYAAIGHVCPDCGAIFVEHGWQAKQMPEEWAKDRKEHWC